MEIQEAIDGYEVLAKNTNEELVTQILSDARSKGTLGAAKKHLNRLRSCAPGFSITYPLIKIAEEVLDREIELATEALMDAPLAETKAKEKTFYEEPDVVRELKRFLIAGVLSHHGRLPVSHDVIKVPEGTHEIIDGPFSNKTVDKVEFHYVDAGSSGGYIEMTVS